MGERIEKLKRIAKNMGETFKKMGEGAGNVLNNLEKADKEMNEKMKNIMQSAEL